VVERFTAVLPGASEAAGGECGMIIKLDAVQLFFEQAEPPFVVERNRMFDGITCDIYGFRKAGMAGRD
jgi:hypothetical protein